MIGKEIEKEIYISVEPQINNNGERVRLYSVGGVLVESENDIQKDKLKEIQETFVQAINGVYSELPEILYAITFDIKNKGKENTEKLFKEYMAGRSARSAIALIENLHRLGYNVFCFNKKAGW